MQFEELTIHEKAIFTYNAIQEKRESKLRGQKEADQHSFKNACKIRKRILGGKNK